MKRLFIYTVISVIAGLGGVFLGCGQGRLAASPAPSGVRAVSAPPQARSEGQVQATAARLPLSAKWRVERQADGRLKIAAEIDRQGLLGIPMQVSVRVPAGVRVITGRTSLVLEAIRAPEATQIPFEFAFSTVPTEDLILVVEGRTADFGYHGEDRYTFGRTPAATPAPRTAGPEIRAGRYRFGQAVPLTSR